MWKNVQAHPAHHAGCHCCEERKQLDQREWWYCIDCGTRIEAPHPMTAPYHYMCPTPNGTGQSLLSISSKPGIENPNRGYAVSDAANIRDVRASFGVAREAEK